MKVVGVIFLGALIGLAALAIWTVFTRSILTILYLVRELFEPERVLDLDFWLKLPPWHATIFAILFGAVYSYFSYRRSKVA